MLKFSIRKARRINTLLFTVARLSTGAQAETRAQTQTFVLLSVFGLGTIGYAFSIYSSKFRKQMEIEEAEVSNSVVPKAVVSRTTRQIVKITSTTSDTHNNSNKDYMGIIMDNDSCITIIDDNLLTNTNNDHVTVTFHDGSKESGVLHSMDKLSGITLIKYQNSKKKIKDVTSTIRDSSAIRIGEQVFGLSYNHNENSTIEPVLGQINELNRIMPYISDPQQYRLSCISVKFPLQRVRKGPIFDTDGNWLGVILPPSSDHTAVNSTSTVKPTITTATILPSSTVVYIAQQLKTHGCVSLPYVGMTLLEHPIPIQCTDNAAISSGIVGSAIGATSTKSKHRVTSVIKSDIVDTVSQSNSSSGHKSVSSSGSNTSNSSDDSSRQEEIERAIYEVVVERTVPGSPAELSGLLR